MMAMGKRAILATLMLAIFASSLVVTVAYAQTTIPTPSVPEFTVKYFENSYEVPAIPPTSPTYTTNPYSGNQTILNPGSPGYPSYHVDNKTIELWIKNQPFSYFNGTTNFHLYYNVRYKGHFGQNWTEYYPTVYLNSVSFNIAPNGSLSKYLNFFSPIQSNSNYTILPWKSYYPVGDQVDYQVKAIIGHDSQSYAGYIVGNFVFQDYYEHATAFDLESDWSPTQTITIPETANSSPTPTIELTPSPTISPSPFATSTPIQPSGQISLPLWVYAVIVAMAFVIGVLVGVIVVMGKRSKQTKPVV
jgi:hypothetical protein